MLTAGVAEPEVDSVVVAATDRISAVALAAPGAPADESAVDQRSRTTKQSAQTLVDKFHSDDRGARATGILPVRINFPQFGSSLYLVSQLTSENQAPSAEFSYQQDKKAGGK